MIDILRVLFEFGSVIAFCMLQFIIYPSLKFYSKDGLIKWYHLERDRIFLFAVILAPGHLIVAVFQLLNRQDAYTITSIGVIFLLWMHHFMIVEPKHRKIIAGIGSTDQILNSISKNNLVRILALVFLLGWSIYNTILETDLWLPSSRN
tara:strand:+ start:12640 stop:13086 length:447 start_codon:yes stop_codon:yes gene_type:complete